MNKEEEEPLEGEEEESEEVEEDDLEDSSAADAALGPDDESDSDETSLDELLSQRAAAKRGADDTEDDTDDIMALTSEKDSPTVDALPTRVVPVKDRAEFVCSNCHLVKARSQLADADRMLCRDCA